MTTSEKIKTVSASVIIGAGAVCQLGGNYYGVKRSDNSPVADREALAKDWRTVGQDLNFALNKGRRECLAKI